MILVTGATGRIGNVLVRELNKRGEKPKVLVRKSSNTKSLDDCDCELVYGDILDPITLEQHLAGVKAIFHLAGYINISPYNADLTNDTNVQGTKNIIYLCKKLSLKMLYTSSIHALSAPEDGSLITEDTPFCMDVNERRGLYDCSKAQATKAVMQAREQGLRSIIVHPTGVIGPYDFRPSFFGAGMVQLVRSGVRITIDGHYDYVDVRDVVKGILDAYEMKKYGERYILSGRILSMKDYVKYLREFANIKGDTRLLGYNMSMLLAQFSMMFNKNSQITPYSVKTLHSNSNISHSKASSELKYQPRGLKESLHDQYEWFYRNGYFE